MKLVYFALASPYAPLFNNVDSNYLCSWRETAPIKVTLLILALRFLTWPINSTPAIEL